MTDKKMSAAERQRRVARFDTLYRGVIKRVSDGMVTDVMQVVDMLNGPNAPEAPKDMTPEDVKFENLRMVVAYVLARQEEAQENIVDQIAAKVGAKVEMTPDAVSDVLGTLFGQAAVDADMPPSTDVIAALFKKAMGLGDDVDVKVVQLHGTPAPDPELVKKVRDIARRQ